MKKYENQNFGQSPINFCDALLCRTVNSNDYTKNTIMTKKMTPSESRRIERNIRIAELYRKHASEFSTKLAAYLFIAEKVGCSHITVYKVLRNGN